MFVLPIFNVMILISFICILSLQIYHKKSAGYARVFLPLLVVPALLGTYDAARFNLATQWGGLFSTQSGAAIASLVITVFLTWLLYVMFVRRFLHDPKIMSSLQKHMVGVVIVSVIITIAVTLGLVYGVIQNIVLTIFSTGTPLSVGPIFGTTLFTLLLIIPFIISAALYYEMFIPEKELPAIPADADKDTKDKMNKRIAFAKLENSKAMAGWGLFWNFVVTGFLSVTFMDIVWALTGPVLSGPFGAGFLGFGAYQMTINSPNQARDFIILPVVVIFTVFLLPGSPAARKEAAVAAAKPPEAKKEEAKK